MWIFLGLLAWILFVELVVRFVRHFYQFPIPPFVARFIDNPLRRRIQPPEQIVEWMGIEKGMSLLEIGPGPGTFTIDAAKAVGEYGTVYAIDIQGSILILLNEKIKQLSYSNISPIQTSAFELSFPDGYFDRVYLVTVLGEIPDRQRALAEFNRVLKDDGYLAIGEFLLDPDYPRRGSVSTWCQKAGFTLVETHGNLMHYLLLFSKTK
jgi:ubiquinone/menaquinone biosynthesis C-methylase UbiE